MGANGHLGCDLKFQFWPFASRNGLDLPTIRLELIRLVKWCISIKFFCDGKLDMHNLSPNVGAKNVGLIARGPCTSDSAKRKTHWSDYVCACLRLSCKCNTNANTRVLQSIRYHSVMKLCNTNANTRYHNSQDITAFRNCFKAPSDKFKGKPDCRFVHSATEGRQYLFRIDRTTSGYSA